MQFEARRAENKRKAEKANAVISQLPPEVLEESP